MSRVRPPSPAPEIHPGQPVDSRIASSKAYVWEKGRAMERKALWVALGIGLLGMPGCGNSKLSAVSVSPAVADAQNFPSGQVQFTAIGSYGSSKPVPLNNVTWCIGSTNGGCNGNI